MSSQVSSSPRQGLRPRQADTVERLIVAGSEVLDDLGPTDLTIRLVAHRAGVSPATAYTYLASKQHLFAEIYLRHLRAHPALSVRGTRTEQVQQVARHLIEVLHASPHLTAAANIALLGDDPEVERLRLLIGTDFVQRFESALGHDPDPRLIDALTFALAGALLQSGMGLLSPTTVADRFDGVITALLEDGS